MGKIQNGCYYCDRDEGFQELLFYVCDLKASKVFLCKDQTLPGRCTIMYKDHYEEIFQIPKAERALYMDDVCALAETIKELFGADKINYGIYGDTCRPRPSVNCSMRIRSITAFMGTVAATYITQFAPNTKASLAGDNPSFCSRIPRTASI